MKRQILFAAMLTCLLPGCMNDEMKLPDEPQADKGRWVTFSVGLPQQDDASRMTYDDEKLTLNWEKGDQIILIENTFDRPSSDIFTLVKGEGTHTGTFEGLLTLEGWRDGYRAIYKSPALQGLEIEIQPYMDYNGQTQRLNGCVDHIRETLMLVQEGVDPNEIAKGIMNLKMQNSVLKINVNAVPSGLGRIECVRWINNYGSDTSTSMMLKLDGEVAQNVSGQTLFLNFMPEEMKLNPGATIALEFWGEQKKMRVTAKADKGKIYEAGNRYEMTVATTAGHGVMSTWTEFQPATSTPGKKEILVKTTGSAPGELIIPGYGTVAPGFENAKRVEVPNSLYWKYVNDQPITALPDRMFYMHNELEEVVLPEGVKSIGEGVFVECSKLKRITLPNTITSIGSQALSFCKALKEVRLPENSSFTVLPSYLFWQSKALESLTIPDNIQSIGESACNDIGIKSLTIPGTVKTIGYSAFADCHHLKEVSVPASVTTPDASMFSSCENLEKAEYHCKKLCSYTFEGCTALQTVDLTGVEEIEYNAFDGCTGLKTVVLPASLTTVGKNIFNGARINSLVIEGTTPEVWGSARGIFQGLNTREVVLTLPKALYETKNGNWWCGVEWKDIISSDKNSQGNTGIDDNIGDYEDLFK